MSTPASFDEEIHAPVRLRICAALGAVSWAEFSAMRESLGVAASVLSKHLARLESIGYVEVTRRLGADARTSTVRLTTAGRAALAGHLAALREIADAAAPQP